MKYSSKVLAQSFCALKIIASISFPYLLGPYHVVRNLSLQWIFNSSYSSSNSLTEHLLCARQLQRNEKQGKEVPAGDTGHITWPHTPAVLDPSPASMLGIALPWKSRESEM